jgi:hypothetical protein
MKFSEEVMPLKVISTPYVLIPYLNVETPKTGEKFLLVNEVPCHFVG